MGMAANREKSGLDIKLAIFFHQRGHIMPDASPPNHLRKESQRFEEMRFGLTTESRNAEILGEAQQGAGLMGEMKIDVMRADDQMFGGTEGGRGFGQ